MPLDLSIKENVSSAHDIRLLMLPDIPTHLLPETSYQDNLRSDPSLSRPPSLTTISNVNHTRKTNKVIALPASNTTPLYFPSSSHHEPHVVMDLSQTVCISLPVKFMSSNFFFCLFCRPK